MKSKIFDEYAKLAEERGLISKSYPVKKQLHRPISDIELLYGIKPNNKEDDIDIVDKAHPDTIVISPAYDRFDGVVENVKERHDIMTHIALKPPNGNYWQERFVTATNDLKMSLVRLGFKYDHEDNYKMMKLADQCLGEIHKEAVAPLLIIGWAAKIAAVLLGYTAIVNNLSPLSQGVVNNTENAIEELTKANEEAYATTQSEINTLISSLRSFLKIANAYLNSGGVDLDPDTATIEDIQNAKNSDAVMSKLRLGRQYISAIRQLKGYLPISINVLKNSVEKEGNWSSFLEPLIKAYRFFDPSSLKDSYLALETLLDSLTEEEKRVQMLLNTGPTKAMNLAIRMRQQAESVEKEQAAPVQKAPTAPVQEQSKEVSTTPVGIISNFIKGL